ncbi:coagulation factor XII isoform X1 [Pelobates cultripes]|uniref:Coagulation factor XII n=1 Tax=Pelobates cultripes TaxID=61616 RepID=A0AAD1RU82_PELCU|nr:coagulation factor XII isoform X1 [Pelobates cultripes]
MNLSCLFFLLAALVIVQAKEKHRDDKEHKDHKERKDHNEHREKTLHKSRHVLTESGQLCHFPFIYARRIYNTCIRRGNQGPKEWCSLTRNYDQDQSWSYCNDRHDVTDHCEDNPCGSRGVCENKLKGYHCVCNEPYTGRNCQTEKCYDKKLGQYFEQKQTWLRYFPPILEECTCHNNKAVVCKVTTGKECSSNPCLHGGHCVQVKKNTVCGCIKGYKGPHCEISPSQVCYHGNGTGYRGTANITVTGKQCLSWDSELIHHEVILYSGHKAKAHGIGPHPYCRNPDGDTEPWCFVLIEERLSWEHCSIPKCNVVKVSTLPPLISITKHSTQGSISSQNKASTAPPKISTTESSTQGSISSGSKSDLPKGGITIKPVQIRGMPVSCEKTFQKTPSVSSRIVGGLVALPASHPYMAALYISSHFCGGALISSCWILTAAHCLERRPDLKEISVVLGQNLFNTTDHRTRRFTVQKYIIHEQYDEETFQNDIALMQLKSESDVCAEFTQFIQPVCLPQNPKKNEPNKQCSVIGWGHQYYGAEGYALFLQEAHIPIIPETQCKSPIVHGNKMLPGMLCAGVMEGGVDACQGDSGGPLVCELEGRVELYGIVSWGTGCAEVNKPGVYTEVSSYINWINANIS